MACCVSRIQIQRAAPESEMRKSTRSPTTLCVVVLQTPFGSDDKTKQDITNCKVTLFKAKETALSLCPLSFHVTRRNQQVIVATLGNQAHNQYSMIGSPSFEYLCTLVCTLNTLEITTVNSFCTLILCEAEQKIKGLFIACANRRD